MWYRTNGIAVIESVTKGWSLPNVHRNSARRHHGIDRKLSRDISIETVFDALESTAPQRPAQVLGLRHETVEDENYGVCGKGTDMCEGLSATESSHHRPLPQGLVFAGTDVVGAQRISASWDWSLGDRPNRFASSAKIIMAGGQPSRSWIAMLRST